MSYTHFKTKKAEYVFQGINHVFSRNHLDAFTGIDALVTEYVSDEDFVQKGSFFEGIELTASFFGNKDLVEQMRNNRTPIYVVDVGIKMTVKGFIRESLTISSDLILFPYSLLNCDVPQRIKAWRRYSGELTESSEVFYRNVVSAEKIEGYLADKISRECGKEIPKIGIRYGIAHISLTDYLKSEELRREKLERIRKQGFKGLKLEQLDRVMKYSYTPYYARWRKQVERTHLFS